MKNIIKSIILLLFISAVGLQAQEPYRRGTTSANFLEIGYGAAGNSMGDAYVSMVNDISSVYWNPAGLGLMEKNEAMFTYQPWFADITTSLASAGLVVDGIGTLALSLTTVSYGEMDVTTLAMQDGTGEKFSANDVAIGLSYGRKLAEWFSFGATAKYVSSSIWHTSAQAMVVDLGVLINTEFFSPTGKQEDGLRIGMSISNYGTPMQYDGMDLLRPIDEDPDEHGNYQNVEGQFKTQEWELPLLFRIGFSIKPIVTNYHKFIISVDALHPNNNSESVNVGAQYSLTFPSFGEIHLRGGYKALFMDSSDYGMSFGIGLTTYMLYNQGIKVEYSYRDHEILGDTHSYGINILF